PSERELCCVDESECHRRRHNCNHHARSARNHWIKESAKKQFLHERAETDCEDSGQNCGERSAKKVLKRNVLRKMKETLQALQRYQRHTQGDQCRPVACRPNPADCRPESLMQ